MSCFATLRRRFASYLQSIRRYITWVRSNDWTNLVTTLATDWFQFRSVGFWIVDTGFQAEVNRLLDEAKQLQGYSKWKPTSDNAANRLAATWLVAKRSDTWLTCTNHLYTKPERAMINISVHTDDRCLVLFGYCVKWNILLDIFSFKVGKTIFSLLTAEYPATSKLYP